MHLELLDAESTNYGRQLAFLLGAITHMVSDARWDQRFVGKGSDTVGIAGRCGSYAHRRPGS